MINNIAHIKFRGSNIGSFFHDNIDNIQIKDTCIIETDDGVELGYVINFEDIGIEDIKKDTPKENYQKKRDDSDNYENTPENKEDTNGESRLKNDKKKIYNILRIASKKDIEQYETNIKDAKEAFRICKEKVTNHKLDLKLVSSYYFFDRAKLLFEFIAGERIDFRELVKDLASHFKTRIELRQIGVRDEARSIGGCGVCGRELCCNVICGGFETITIKMAKEQGMLLNTAKISGQCGRLMCCLGHEYKTYCKIKKDLPKTGTKLVFNNVPAVIRDVNPLSKKLFIETEDKRFLYIDMKNVKNENGMLVANIKAE